MCIVKRLLLTLLFFFFVSSNFLAAQNMYMGIWGQEKGTDFYWRDANLHHFTNKYKEFAANGHYLHDVETYTKNGQRLFAGIFRKGKPSPAVGTPSSFGASRGRTSGRGSRGAAAGANIPKKKHFLLVAEGWNFLIKKYGELIDSGLRLKDIETWKQNGKRFYIGVFEEGNVGHGIWGGSSWDNFLETWNAMAGKNTQLIDIETYEEAGKRHYIGVYRQGPGMEQSLWAHVEWSKFAPKLNELKARGRALMDMETYIKNGKRFYIGVFRGVAQKSTFEFRMSWQEFETQKAAYEKSMGTHIEDFDVYDGVDFELFSKNVNKELKDKCIGYGYAIFKDGQMAKSGSGGYRVLSQDGTPQKFTPTTVKGLHSTVKPLTAMAVVKLLSSLGKDESILDKPIYPYLPKYWKIHDEIKTITFRQLLTHTSGIDGTRDTYVQMKALMKSGKNYKEGNDPYANVNFTLFRIIIPYLAYPQEMKFFEENTIKEELLAASKKSQKIGNKIDKDLDIDAYAKVDKIMAKKTANRYVKYMKENIFAPAGVNGGTTPYGPTLFSYNFKEPKKKGIQAGEGLLITGAGGMFMNAVEYNQVLAALDSGKLMPKNWVEIMKTQELGVYAHTGQNGDYYTHNGGSPYGVSDMMIYPNNVSIYIQVNSTKNAFKNKTDIMREAYDNAYIE